MKYIYTIIIPLITVLASCQDDNGTTKLTCDQTARISKVEFPNAPDDPVVVNAVSINKNCLIISYSSDGCNGNTWSVEMIDSGDVIETAPPRRNIVFVLHNDEDCNTNITKEVSFDVSPLQVDGNSVILILQNTGEEILYQY